MTTIFRCGTTACAHLRRGSARLHVFLKLFFAGDPYPETPATIARAKAAQIADRQRYRVDCDGHPLLIRGLSAVQRAGQDTANVVYFGEERRRLLAKSLIDECGQVTGPAWTFERREK